MDLMDCKIYRKPQVREREGERVKLESLDIPIINHDNAIVVANRKADDSYVKIFKVSTITNGLTFHEGQYYWFDHNIVATPKTYSTGEIHSYNIYPIKNSLADKIINTLKYNCWEIMFHSYYNYGNVFLSVGSIYGASKYKYSSILTFDDEGDKMFCPYGTSPSGFKDGQTFSEFITEHIKNYPNSGSNVVINKSGMREVLLDFIGI